MKNITPIEKRMILNDWTISLKFYSKYKSMNLLKRNGPIVMGIYLRPVASWGRYTPVFYIHSLMIPFSAITLGAYGGIFNKLGAEDSFSFKNHADNFEEIILKFKSQHPVAFSSAVDFLEINKIYKSSIEKSNIYPVRDMESHILLMYWCKRDPSEIESEINSYQAIINSWPKNIQFDYGDTAKWSENIKRLMNFSFLTKTMNDEIIKFKLEKIKDYPLMT